MECKVTDLEDSKKKFHIQLSTEDFASEIEELLKEVAKTAELPGFRKGKIPLQLLRSKLGEAKVRGDALNGAISKYLTQAIEDEALDVIAVLDVDIVSGLESDPVVFEATAELRPSQDISGYRDMEVEIPPVLPTEEEISKIETSYLKSFGELSDVHRNAIDGDHITIELKATYNGESVEGMNVSDYVYELGSESPIQGLQKELSGAKIGDILEFNAPHPQQEGNMRIKVLVKKIQENKVPPLTDELAKDISEFQTAEELREDLQTQIKESKRNNLLHILQGKVLTELEKLVTHPIPEALIDTEIRSISADIPENEAQKLQTQIRERAVSSVKLDLGLRSVARQEKLEVDTDEVQKAVEEVKAQIAQLSSPNASDLRPNESAIAHSLLRQKTLEWLMENVQIKDENNSKVDILEIKPPKVENEDASKDDVSSPQTETETEKSKVD